MARVLGGEDPVTFSGERNEQIHDVTDLVLGDCSLTERLGRGAEEGSGGAYASAFEQLRETAAGTRDRMRAMREILLLRQVNRLDPGDDRIHQPVSLFASVLQFLSLVEADELEKTRHRAGVRVGHSELVDRLVRSLEQLGEGPRSCRCRPCPRE